MTNSDLLLKIKERIFFAKSVDYKATSKDKEEQK